MIIFGFADTYNECANTLSGDNPRAHNVRQDFSPERRVVTQPVSGAAGGYDFYGDQKWPAEQVTARVEFDMMGDSFANAGERAQTLVDALKKKGRSRLWFITRENYLADELPASPAVFKNAGTLGTITGTTRISGSPYGDVRVRAINANGEVVASAISAITGAYTLTVPAGTYQLKAGLFFDALDELSYQVFYTDTIASVTVAAGATSTGNNFNLVVDATADASEIRWAWAKVQSASVAENAGDDLIERARVTAEFVLTEGVMYGALVRLVAKTEASAATFNLTSAGTGAAPIRLALTATGDSITAFRFTNNGDSSYVNYAGTVAAGALNLLIIDSDAQSVTNAGTADFASLTLNTGQILWSYIEPDVGETVQSFTVALTQATPDWDLTISYRDVYEL